ncbi:speckle-type POZ protein-like [Planococcus citri]|uniref:speckle-type POZ protein-like n=1 Tax=Planococcus citri TaxID=170843 RepID=UPI0031F9EB90
MNPFYITGVLFFAFYCIGQTEPTNPSINVDSENILVHCKKTCAQVHEIKYTWVIKNFSAYDKYTQREFLSPKIRALTTDRIELDLRLHPNGWTGSFIEDVRFNIFTSSESIVKEVLADCDVSIINHNKEVLLNKHLNSIICVPVRKDRWIENDLTLCSNDDFFQRHLLQNDTLTMLFHIKCFLKPSANDVSLQPKIPTPDTVIVKNNLSENFESMLNNPEFADVVFITNGGNFSAHKLILAARSPVFAGMFRRKDTKNGKNKKIRINEANMDEEVLHAMLKYIYTGKCDNFEKLADKLFVAAAKYGLDGLRKICEEELCESLSVDNAVRLLAFAEKHHADKLKSRVKEVIANGLLAS